MKYLQTFEKFITDASRLLQGNISDVHNSISLYKVADRIYAVVIEDDYLRGMVFLRCQEFYESSSPEFQGQKFTWNRYMDWYKSEEGPRGKSDQFTYGADWAGFNLPSESIEKCMSDIDDPNEYDHCMASIVKAIRKQESANFYLLGVEKVDTSDVLNHELAHGFWYTDPEYKSEMFNLIKSSDKEKIKSLSDIIISYGYNETVLPDEIQAYLSTGLASKMKDLGLEEILSLFKSTFERFKEKHHTSPEQIKIEY